MFNLVIGWRAWRHIRLEGNRVLRCLTFIQYSHICLLQITSRLEIHSLSLYVNDCQVQRLLLLQLITLLVRVSCNNNIIK